MSDRYLNWVTNLTPGNIARAEDVTHDFEQVQAAFDAVEQDVNTTLRFTGRVSGSGGSTPTQSSYQIAATPQQRAGRVIGFDGNGDPITLAQAFNWRGTWATTTVYAVNDVVFVPPARYSAPGLYLCAAGNTASGSFGTDTSDWSVMVDCTQLFEFIRNFQIIAAANSPFQAAPGNDLMVDVSSGPVEIVMWANPSISDQSLSIVHLAGNVVGNPITVHTPDGALIMGLAEDMQITTTNAACELSFSNATYGWRLVRGT